MHILLAADQYPEYRNGAGAFTDRLAAGLAGRGLDVTLVYPAADGRRQSRARSGVLVERLPSMRLPRGQGLRVCLPGTARAEAERLMAGLKVDVAHVQSHFSLGRAVVAAARAKSVPVIATNHFMPENLLPHVPVPNPLRARLGEWAWRDLARIFGGVDAITTPTPRAADLLAARSGLPRARVVSNGVDLDRFAPHRSATSTQRAPFVLFVGRLEVEKRVEPLLEAFTRLHPATDAHLV